MKSFLGMTNQFRPHLRGYKQYSPLLHDMTKGYFIGIGAYLFQVIDDKERLIAILSRTLIGAQLNWSTIEKECFATYYALREWEYLLRDTKFTIRTDHKNLTFINLDHKEKVKRWKIAISSYDFQVSRCTTPVVLHVRVYLQSHNN